jgi:tetratricopeptide (TPR) repeat protein
MKKYILFAIMLIPFASCKDFLKLHPENQINASSFYKNANDFNTAMIGAYSGLQQLYDYSVLALGELTTDNLYVQWSSPTTSIQESDQVSITPTNDFVGALWSTCFTTISRANAILENIDNASISDDLKSQYKGEALFLRAYCYFHLVRFFGDLPIVKQTFKSPSEVAAFDMTRKPVADVYAMIIDDLNNAATLLANVTGLGKERASTGAAKTLLGKVYLTQKNYPLAISTLKEVIDMQKYSLATNYGSLFTNGNHNAAETIFEISYLSGNVGEGNDFSSFLTPALFNMALFPGNMNGSGEMNPTKDAYDSYEPGDARRDATMGYPTPALGGGTEPFTYGKKFVDFTVGVSGDGGVNFTALRYADVLLMYAEALNENNQTSEALTYLNLVRARAKLDPLSGLSKADFELAMERERRFEFMFEGQRWLDLVRTGRAIPVLNAYFTKLGLAFRVDEHKLLMPLPLREIEIDPRLTQNPGY